MRKKNSPELKGLTYSNKSDDLPTTCVFLTLSAMPLTFLFIISLTLYFSLLLCIRLTNVKMTITSHPFMNNLCSLTKGTCGAYFEIRQLFIYSVNRTIIHLDHNHPRDLINMLCYRQMPLISESTLPNPVLLPPTPSIV